LGLTTKVVGYIYGMSRHLLILDLDETLIYAAEEPLDRMHDFAVGRYSCYRRPGLQSFLKTCDALFELAVWSSSTTLYADAVVSQIFLPDVQLAFLWARERCTLRLRPEAAEDSWLKNLKKVKRKGYSLDQVLVVDDSPEKLARNYGNLITVQPFVGSPDDEELMLLRQYLPSLASVKNVRAIEKRDWRHKASRV
jgi:TFIIF-interacting CTD phosphatase-like protein